MDRANAPRIFAALADFGFSALDLCEADFLEPDVIIQLGYPPKRIDLLTGIDGVNFDEVYDKRMLVDFDEVSAPVIDLNSLIANKRASARYQDLADVEALMCRHDPDQ